jgi:hypothetical protein
MSLLPSFRATSNFGILTRQRTQVLPLVLVLLVLPRETHRMEEPAPTLENRARQLAQSPSPVRWAAHPSGGVAARVNPANLASWTAEGVRMVMLTDDEAGRRQSYHGVTER